MLRRIKLYILTRFFGKRAYDVLVNPLRTMKEDMAELSVIKGEEANTFENLAQEAQKESVDAWDTWNSLNNIIA